MLKKYKLGTAILCVLLLGLVLIVVTKTAKNPYNTYALQAASWLAGRTDLGQNYAHLEIATYGGKFYASFPPFPSVVLLPFVLLFGTSTPDAFLSLFFAALSVYFAYQIAMQYQKSDTEAIFWALFVTIGSNFLTIMFEGWVWFFAQTLSFTFSMGAIYAALRRRPVLSFLLLAFACGCRPFQLLYCPILVMLLREKEVAWKQIAYALLPAFLVGLLYMGYNVLRFGNPFEFGHNYLPEFLANRQFSLSYLPQNLYRLVRLPALEAGHLVIPLFDGFAFYLVSPIFILYVLQLVHAPSKSNCFLFFLLLLHLVFLCCHRTMGGWHFGNRYTVDLLPFVLLGCVWQRKKLPATPVCILLLFYGILVNTAGILFLLLFS